MATFGGPLPAIDYATSKDWLDIMKNRSKLRMHELIERLNLRAKWSQNKRGKTNFESALVREMVADMSEVVATLPKDSEELVKFLSADGSLKEQVDGLLQKHGSAIWGRAADREHLTKPRPEDVEVGLVSPELFYEVEGDREQIRILLHWWLGMKAINVILARERLDRERKKKEEIKKAKVDLDAPQESVMSTFIPLAPNASLPIPTSLNTNTAPVPMAEHPRHIQIYQAETASRGSPISSSMVTPPESNASPVLPGRGGGSGDASHFNAMNINARHPPPAQSVVDGVWDRLGAAGPNASRHGSMSSQAPISASPWPTVKGVQQQGPRRSSLSTELSSHPVQPVDTSGGAPAIRQLGAEISQLVSDLTPQSTSDGPTALSAASADATRNGGPYRGLDVETLQALRAYIYQEESEVVWEEEVLLRRLETAWRDGVRSDVTRINDNIPAFVARERAFLTWLELKRHLADLSRADVRWREEGSTAPEIERRIQQHRTLMSATREILRSYQDITQVTDAGADHDELLRQAFVVLAGNKYAVELQWKTVDFVKHVQWLAPHLEAYEREQDEGTEYYFGQRVFT